MLISFGLIIDKLEWVWCCSLWCAWKSRLRSFINYIKFNNLSFRII